MRTITLLTGVLTVLVLAFGGTNATATGDSSVAVHSSKYGQILFDGRGFALYSFTHDPAGKSTCAGACAKAWPPYVVHGAVRAVAGAKSGLLGTIRRSDGATQVTYAGRPLYYYVGDRKAGQILCQNVTEFGGTWLVVRGTGQPVQ
jgi:predicted lipoprotein with Yx(FWY)xxD motif